MSKTLDAEKVCDSMQGSQKVSYVKVLLKAFLAHRLSYSSHTTMHTCHMSRQERKITEFRSLKTRRVLTPFWTYSFCLI